MKKSRVVKRDGLNEDTLKVLREFTEWFLPATMDEIGNEFLMFLKWLEKNEYMIVPEEYKLLDKGE